jgi:hypothetical protein
MLRPDRRSHCRSWTELLSRATRHSSAVCGGQVIARGCHMGKAIVRPSFFAWRSSESSTGRGRGGGLTIVSGLQGAAYPSSGRDADEDARRFVMAMCSDHPWFASGARRSGDIRSCTNSASTRRQAVKRPPSAEIGRRPFASRTSSMARRSRPHPAERAVPGPRPAAPHDATRNVGSRISTHSCTAIVNTHAGPVSAAGRGTSDAQSTVCPPTNRSPAANRRRMLTVRYLLTAVSNPCGVPTVVTDR